MTTDHEHPAARYDDRVTELAGRAKLAVIALAATIAIRVWDAGVRQWSLHLLGALESSDENAQVALQANLEAADGLVNSGLVADYVVLAVTAVLFLRWVHLLVTLTRAFGDGYLSWRPSSAVWGFFLPIVSLFRPYQVLRDVHAALDPRNVLPPTARIDRDAAGDYRSVALITPPEPKPLPKGFIGVWWGVYVMTNILSRIVNANEQAATTVDGVSAVYRGDILVDVVDLVAAVLAIRVVSSVTARLAERFRRIRYTTPESLEAQGVSIR